MLLPLPETLSQKSFFQERFGGTRPRPSSSVERILVWLGCPALSAKIHFPLDKFSHSPSSPLWPPSRLPRTQSVSLDKNWLTSALTLPATSFMNVKHDLLKTFRFYGPSGCIFGLDTESPKGVLSILGRRLLLRPTLPARHKEWKQDMVRKR